MSESATLTDTAVHRSRSQRRLDERLARLREKNVLPAPLVDLVEAVHARQVEAMTALEDALASGREVTLPPLASAERHAQGVPLVERTALPYDQEGARDLLRELLALAAAGPDPLGTAGKTLLTRLDAGEVEPEASFTALLEEDEEAMAGWAKLTPEAPMALRFAVTSALSPSLRVLAREIAKHHDTETAWPHGTCPVCGSLPLMADLKEKQGYRHATCSLCLTSYRVPRLHCLYCGETEQEQLAYFRAEEEPGFRVETCKSCSFYLKTTDLREFERQAYHLLDDLESLTLDLLASREGFVRPTHSAFGF